MERRARPRIQGAGCLFRATPMSGLPRSFLYESVSLGTFQRRMGTEATRPEDDLDLPPLDGVEEEAEVPHEDVEVPDDGGDALDDATSDVAWGELETGGAETGLLAGSEDAAVDVGTFDVALEEEGKVLHDDEPDEQAPHEDLSADDALESGGDTGEEGPLADDEELKEEDLPELDADEDGDVDEEGLYDRAALATEEELRWDDRAWARVPDLADGLADAPDDSGMLATPGEDPQVSARDATWRRLDESGRVTAAVLGDGDDVILAMTGPDRPVLVRIDADGVARIVAEIEVGDDEDPAHVSHLRWDRARGWLLATGTFGVQAFHPSAAAAAAPAPVKATTPV